MDLEAIRAKHIPVPATMTKRKDALMCTSCCDPWPCDTEKVLAELDVTRKVLSDLLMATTLDHGTHGPPSNEANCFKCRALTNASRLFKGEPLVRGADEPPAVHGGKTWA